MAKKRAIKKKAAPKTKAAPKKAVAASSGARLFEFSDGKSDKFWEITVAGKSHTVRFGRVGTDGQSKTKDFADASKAQTDADKLIAQKTKKGYREVQNKSAARSVQAVASKQELKQHEPFLKAIRDDPDNPDPYGVYADWLADRGDPRGEFIQLQWQLEDTALKGETRKKVAAREKQLLRKHQREWLGELAEELIDNPRGSSGSYRFQDDAYKFSFARGFLDSVSVSYLLPDVARQLGTSPAAAMLRTLKIGFVDYGEFIAEEFPEFADKNWGMDVFPSMDALALGRFENLRELRISEEGSYGSCHIRTPGIHKVVKNSPRLEILHLDSHDVGAKSLFRVEMTSLKSLTLNHDSEYPLEILAKNASLGRLESIHIFPHCFEYDDDAPYITLKGLKAVCNSHHLESLKHLHLMNTDFGDKGIREIVRSGILKQLESLTLVNGAATDAAVSILAEADLGSLQRLDLGGNYLTADGVKRLKKLKVKCEAKEQFDGDPDDEEKEHLMQGDYE